MSNCHHQHYEYGRFAENAANVDAGRKRNSESVSIGQKNATRTSITALNIIKHTPLIRSPPPHQKRRPSSSNIQQLISLHKFNTYIQHGSSLSTIFLGRTNFELLQPNISIKIIIYSCLGAYAYWMDAVVKSAIRHFIDETSTVYLAEIVFAVPQSYKCWEHRLFLPLRLNKLEQLEFEI